MDKAQIIKALRDTAQAASNTAASTVSGPVDLLAAALRYGGIPVPENALGGSKWMAERGLTQEVEQGVPRVVGETLGMVGPALATQFAPQIAGAINKGAANLAAPARLNKETGAIVWHGSPHKFDKFDSSKIGTGEGAQAYGHGLYLAESPEVAQSYRAAVSADKGKAFGLEDGPVKGVATLIAGRGEKGEALARQAYASLGDQLEPTIAAAKRAVNNASSLYKVDLPDDAIAKMLDWDKPLSQQGDAVQSFINMVKTSPEKAGFSAVPRADGMVDIVAPTGEILGRESAEMAQEAMRIYADGFISNAKTGADLVKRFASPGTLNKQTVMQNPMQAAGIPGVRYLDGGSRGAGGGTSNFVVFPGNESMLQILERNGQPLGLMGVK